MKKNTLSTLTFCLLFSSAYAEENSKISFIYENMDIEKQYDLSINAAKGNNGIDLNLNIYNLQYEKNLTKDLSFLANIAYGTDGSQNELWEKDYTMGDTAIYNDKNYADYYKVKLGIKKELSSYMDFNSNLVYTKLSTESSRHPEDNNSKIEYEDYFYGIENLLILKNKINSNTKIGLNLGLTLGETKVENIFSEIDAGIPEHGKMKFKSFTYEASISPWIEYSLTKNISTYLAYEYKVQREISNSDNSYYDTDGGNIAGFDTDNFKSDSSSIKFAINYSF